MNKVAEGFEKVWEILCAVALYGVAMNFTVALFREWAGVDPWMVTCFIAMAFAFESTKISLWIKGVHDGNRKLKALAISFAFVSVFAGLIQTVSTVSNDAVASEKVEAKAEDVAKERKELADSYELTLNTIQVRFSKAGALSLDSTNKYLSAIEDLKEKKKKALEDFDREREPKAELEASVLPRDSGRGAYQKVAGYLGVSNSIATGIQIIFLSFITILVETGGMVMAALAIEKRKGKKDEGLEEPEESDADSGDEDAEIVLRPLETFAHWIFTPPHRNSNGAVPGYQRVKELGISKEEYEKVIEKGIMNGSLKRRKGKVYRSSVATKEDFMEVIDGSN